MTARIFVTTYSIYNNGLQFKSNKHGFWLDVCDYDEDQLIENFNEVDPSCFNDHELMFTDYEGFPSSLYSESSLDIEAIQSYDLLDDDQKEIIELLLDNHYCKTVQDAIDKLDDCYIFDGDLTDYAIQYCEDCGLKVEDSFLSNYIDYESMGRDLYHDGEILKISHSKLLIINF